MEANDRERLVQALDFAVEAHGHQKRKGKDVPYVSHLLQVAGHVLEYGGDVDLAIAGLLHDTVEDCPDVTPADIEERFGAHVAQVVRNCTDLLEEDTPERKSDWLTRKERYIAHLRTTPFETRLVAACDKLHNLANLVADVRAHGPGVLDRFNGSPRQTVWFYEGVLQALGEDLPIGLLTELEVHLVALRRVVGRGA